MCQVLIRYLNLIDNLPIDTSYVIDQSSKALSQMYIQCTKNEKQNCPVLEILSQTNGEQLLMFRAKRNLLGFVSSDTTGVYVADVSTVADPHEIYSLFCLSSVL